MTTTGATAVSPVFVDTNVLVYATLGESAHCSAARRLIDRLERSGTELWVSQQVLREFVAALTRPQGPSVALPVREVVALTRQIERRFCVAEEHQIVREQLYLRIEQIPTGDGRSTMRTSSRRGWPSGSGAWRRSTPPTSSASAG